MHELAITQSILSLVLAEAAKAGAERVTRVSMKAGEWSSIEPDCVEFYFGVLAKGTIAEGADLSIERVPVRFRCENCELDYAPAEDRFSCPQCSNAKGVLVSGRELLVDSIEVQFADTDIPKSRRRK